MRASTIFAFAAALAATVYSAPSANVDDGAHRLDARAAPDNTVHITSVDDFCIIMPRTKYTTIGDSEHPGGMRSYCSKPYGGQGTIKPGLFTHKYISRKAGRSGQRQIQLTGCINPSASTRLVPNDGGGQYDSSGGAGGRGNPEGSVCLGYNHYVEILEPDSRRACIRCCDNFNDCDVSRDTSGCGVVIPGNYNGC